MLKMNFILLLTIFVSSAAAQTPYRAIVTKTEKDVIPEGITVNPLNGKIYVSSIALRKIIEIDSVGNHRDFIKAGQDEFVEGLGMKIDARKQWLWVVSNHKGGRGISHVHAFELKTGRVRQHYQITDTTVHLLNDLILHPNGKVYITDTYASCIYEVDPAKKKLKVLIKDKILNGANGIAFNEKGKVYVATRDGLLQWEVSSKNLTPLAFSDGRRSLWLDGLVYHNNSIIGVADNAIVQYQLNEKGDQIVSEKIIDEKNSFFRDPTTIALYKNLLYAIANSNLAVYNENKESVKGIDDKLGSVVILVYQLRN